MHLSPCALNTLHTLEMIHNLHRRLHTLLPLSISSSNLIQENTFSPRGKSTSLLRKKIKASNTTMDPENTTGSQESVGYPGNRRINDSGPLGEVLKRLKPSTYLKPRNKGSKMQDSDMSTVDPGERFSPPKPETEDSFSPPPPKDIMVEMPTDTEDEYSSLEGSPSQILHFNPDEIQALANAIESQPKPSSKSITLRGSAPRDSSIGNHYNYDSESEPEEEVCKTGQGYGDYPVSAHSMHYSKSLRDIKRALAAQHLRLARAKLLKNRANSKPPILTPMVFPTTPWSDEGHSEDKVFGPRDDPLELLMHLLYGEKTWTGRRTLDKPYKKKRPTEAEIWQLMKEGGLKGENGAPDPVAPVPSRSARDTTAADNEPTVGRENKEVGTLWDEM